jgi:hypothetical protein
VFKTIHENLGNLDPVSNFVQVRTAPPAIALQVFSVGDIIGYMHVSPERSTSSKKADDRNEQWIVNTHIDLPTWQDVID